MLANEEKAKTTLAKIRDAEVEFEKRHGKGNYASLSELVKEGLVLSELEDGEDSGYRFTINTAKRKYSAQAVPIDYPTDESHRAYAYYDYSFYLDQSGLIRMADMPRIAGPSDPPTEKPQISQ